MRTNYYLIKSFIAEEGNYGLTIFVYTDDLGDCVVVDEQGHKVTYKKDALALRVGDRIKDSTGCSYKIVREIESCEE